MFVNETDPPATDAHEVGHASGAGGQYPGDYDMQGKPWTAPKVENTIRGDLRGHANGLTFKEIFEDKKNTVFQFAYYEQNCTAKAH
jgi:hypothetical protein